MMDWNIKVIVPPTANLKIPKEDYHCLQMFATVTCDLLWSYRNRAYHCDLSFDALQMSRNINKVCLEHIMACKHLSNSLVEQKWIPPPPSSWLKINFDTTIRDTYSAQAAVCHNHYGHIIKMNSQISLMCLPNMGEALASRLTTSLASSLNTKRFIIEGDSKIVILALQQPNIAQD
jgi:hypothetical protein